jgi:hypothetical protein
MGSCVKAKTFGIFERRVDKRPATIDGAMLVDSYEPDYEGECESCGASAIAQPLVTVVRHGRRIAHLGMCGPCVWGEAAMLNPREWNE